MMETKYLRSRDRGEKSSQFPFHNDRKGAAVGVTTCKAQWQRGGGHLIQAQEVRQ